MEPLKQQLKILSIDPSFTGTGWVLIEDKVITAWGLIKIPPKTINKYHELHQELSSLIQSIQPDFILLESQYMKVMHMITGCVLASIPHKVIIKSLNCRKVRFHLFPGESPSKINTHQLAHQRWKIIPDNLDNNVLDALLQGIFYSQITYLKIEQDLLQNYDKESSMKMKKMMSEKQDKKMDKKMGIKENSKKDSKVDKKAGVKKSKKK